MQKISKHPKIYSWIFFCFWSKNPCLTKIDKYDVLTVAFDSFPFGPFFTSVRSVVRSCWTTKIFLKFTKNNAAPNVNSFDEWIFNNRHHFALLNWSDEWRLSSEHCGLRDRVRVVDSRSSLWAGQSSTTGWELLRYLKRERWIKKLLLDQLTRCVDLCFAFEILYCAAGSATASQQPTGNQCQSADCQISGQKCRIFIFKLSFCLIQYSG